MRSTAGLVEEFHCIDWDFNESTRPRQDLHPYPARFIPEIPAAALGLLEPDGPVLDPFCGSGTTLVEASRRGLPAIGVDLHPIACLISRVKLARLDEGEPTRLSHFSADLEEAIRGGSPPDLGDPSFSIPRLDHWFEPWAQGALAGAVGYLARIPSDDPWRDRVALAISASTVRISRQESDTRYAAVSKSMDLDRAVREIVRTLERIVSWRAENRLSGDSQVHQANAQSLTFLSSNSVSAAIFSPPYPNAYEYWLYHKYRMYWLGFDPLQVRASEIGARPHYVGKNGLTEDDFAAQMRDVFRELRRVLRPRAKTLVVIGDSRIRGRSIDNGELLTTVATLEGFKPVAATTRAIRQASSSFNRAHSRARSGEHVLLMERAD